MFQASLALGVLAISYGVHAKVHPFVTPEAQDAAFARVHKDLVPASMMPRDGRVTSARGAASAGGRAKALRATLSERISRMVTTATTSTARDGGAALPAQRRRSSVLAAAAAAAAVTATAVQEMQRRLLDFNTLETVLLCSSTGVLLGGMVFQSAEMRAGSFGYTLVTVFVGAVVIGSVGVFGWMLTIETKRTCRQRRTSAFTVSVLSAVRTSPLYKAVRRMTTFRGAPTDAAALAAAGAEGVVGGRTNLVLARMRRMTADWKGRQEERRVVTRAASSRAPATHGLASAGGVMHSNPVFSAMRQILTRERARGGAQPGEKQTGDEMIRIEQW